MHTHGSRLCYNDHMPELPEVETIATELRRMLVGKTVMDVIVHRAEFIRTQAPDPRSSLRNRGIVDIERHGKRIYLRLKPDGCCVIHLGMSGRATLELPVTPLAPHTHLCLRFGHSSRELRLRDPRRFGGFWFFDDSPVPQAPDPRSSLRNRGIVDIERHGKRIYLRLKPDGCCVIHLGMSGRATLELPVTPLAPHTHLCLRFGHSSRELRLRDPRRFGGFWFFDGLRNGDTPPLSPLGPDALTIRVPQLRHICRRRRQIKALLLDQRAISGLGNIYCDEALFAARIHPLQRASDLGESQVRSLRRRQMCRS